MTVRTGAKPGPFAKAIAVTTNDPDHRNESLICQTTILAAMRLGVDSLNFGQVAVGQTPQRRTVTIARGDGGPIHPQLRPITDRGLKAQLREIKPGEQYELDVELGPPWPNGPVRQWLKLQTGVARCSEMSLFVQADVEPRLRITPEAFVLPFDVLQEPRTQTLNLRWADGGPHQVLEARVDDAKLQARIEVKDGAQQIVLEAPAGYQPLTPVRKVTLQTDHQELGSVEIPVKFIKMPRRAAAAMAGAPAAGAASAQSPDPQTRPPPKKVTKKPPAVRRSEPPLSKTAK